jgi:hypothetical protein
MPRRQPRCRPSDQCCGVVVRSFWALWQPRGARVRRRPARSPTRSSPGSSKRFGPRASMWWSISHRWNTGARGRRFCASPATRVACPPNVDAAVIELGRSGRAPTTAGRPRTCERLTRQFSGCGEVAVSAQADETVPSDDRRSSAAPTSRLLLCPEEAGAGPMCRGRLPIIVQCGSGRSSGRIEPRRALGVAGQSLKNCSSTEAVRPLSPAVAGTGVGGWRQRHP